MIPKWLHLNKVVETGRPAAGVNLEEAGGDFFQRFVVDIFPLSYPAAQALPALERQWGRRRVLDLAAGSGVWSIALAQGSEQATVTVVDWPEVIGITRKTVGKFGLAERYSFIAAIRCRLTSAAGTGGDAWPHPA